MNDHYHRCSLCNVPPISCDSPMCWTEPQFFGDALVYMGRERPCSACEAGLAEVDNLPTPQRGELGGATLVRVCARATRAALVVAATHPEDAAEKFAQHVDALAPVDDARTDPDTWWRLGAVAGAKAAWAWDPKAGPVFRLPPDAPKGEAAECYLLAWNDSSSVVLRVRMEMIGKC